MPAAVTAMLDDRSNLSYVVFMGSAAETDVRQSILATAQGIMSAKGFSAVGLNEILVAAGVPKGSFYHYFGSKNAFGDALLKAYFEGYLADLEAILATPGLTHAERLAAYWDRWRDTQGGLECQGKCLAVKLAAEVSDLSEAMRLTLRDGTEAVIDRLSRSIGAGVAEGSLSIGSTPRETAESLYHSWLGASLMAKIVQTTAPFDSAMAVTRRLLFEPHPRSLEIPV